jgi:hypothetical protein
LLNYINIYRKDYYNTGVLQSESNITIFQADKEVVQSLVSGAVKIVGMGVKALIQAKFSPPKYILPK